MRRLLPLFTIYYLLVFLLTACGAAATPFVPVPQVTPTALLSETPIAEPPTPTLTPVNTAAVTPTTGPTPTETFLPLLVLPTLEAVEPALDVWDGVPTYLGDSQPGFYFRVKYNPRAWALAQDSFGQPALSHREIAYCILAPGGVHGLAPGLQVEHDMRKLGALNFEVNVALLNGQRQFVTYQATDGTIFTSFQVNFVDRIDDCLAAAEIVLGTLASVAESQATPVP